MICMKVPLQSLSFNGRSYKYWRRAEYNLSLHLPEYTLYPMRTVDVVYIPRTQHYSNLLFQVPFSVGAVRVCLSFSMNN